ncbi:hypothetical protein Fmac_013660 [Flemingia macrophylla]|uniref:Uncharacterized protein n=1 Tax=Flemingia macrophylla TaxID=520843 RepID=A0ABD1MTR4_9FABA
MPDQPSKFNKFSTQQHRHLSFVFVFVSPPCSGDLRPPLHKRLRSSSASLRHHALQGGRILHFLLRPAQPQHARRGLDLHRRRRLRRHGVAPPPPRRSLPLLTLAGRDATDAFLAFHPPSAALLLPRLSKNLRLSDHAVSPASSDYRRLLSELSGAGLFERKGHTTVALLSVILPLLVLSERASVHALFGALTGLAWIQSG